MEAPFLVNKKKLRDRGYPFLLLKNAPNLTFRFQLNCGDDDLLMENKKVQRSLERGKKFRWNVEITLLRRPTRIYMTYENLRSSSLVFFYHLTYEKEGKIKRWVDDRKRGRCVDWRRREEQSPITVLSMMRWRSKNNGWMRITLKNPLLNGSSRSRLNSMAETFKTYMQIFYSNFVNLSFGPNFFK